MKKVISLLLVFVLLSGLTATYNLANAADKTPVRRALLVGNNYVNSKNRLYGCFNDVDYMQALLKKTYIEENSNALFNKDTIAKKKDITKKQTLDAIAKTFASATENDISIFYFSGHGSFTGGTAYINSTDYSISVDELAAALNKIPGKIVVLLDSCHSGGFINKGAYDVSGNDIVSIPDEELSVDTDLGADDIFEVDVDTGADDIFWDDISPEADDIFWDDISPEVDDIFEVDVDAGTDDNAGTDDDVTSMEFNQSIIDAFESLSSGSLPRASLVGSKFYVLTSSSSANISYEFGRSCGLFTKLLIDSTGYEIVIGSPGKLKGSPKKDCVSLNDAYKSIAAAMKNNYSDYHPNNNVQASPANSAFPLFPLLPAKKPTNVKATGITPVSAKISWDSVTGATKYQVDTKIVDSNGKTIARKTHYTGTLKNYTVTGLDPKTKYTACVYAFFGDNKSDGGFFTFTTLEIPKPSVRAPTSVTPVSAKISWDSVAGATKYQVDTKIVDNNGQAIVRKTHYTGTLTNCSLKGLDPKTKYTVCVYAFFGDKKGGGGFYTFTTPDIKPTVNAATSITPVSAKVSWGAVAGATKYQVDTKIVDSNGKIIERKTHYTGTLTNCSLKGLDPKTKYTVCVYAFVGDVKGSGGFHSLTTPEIPKPSVNAATSITPVSAKVSWGSIAGVTKYQVDTKIVDSNGKIIERKTHYTGTLTNCSLKGLDPKTKYTVCVYAFFDDNKGSGGFHTFTTPEIPKPSVKAPTSVTSTSAKVSWGSVAGATKYQVDTKIVDSNGKEISRKTHYTGTLTNCSLIGLSPKTQYTVCVYAFIGDNNKSSGGFYTFTTPK